VKIVATEPHNTDGYADDGKEREAELLDRTGAERAA
jgi:hypothetical protein